MNLIWWFLSETYYRNRRFKMPMMKYPDPGTVFVGYNRVKVRYLGKRYFILA